MDRKIVPFHLTKADERGFEGYASVFRSPDGATEPDLTGDMVVKGAFAKTITERGNRVKVLWQHNTEQVLGRPIELREDERGLFIKAKVSDTSLGRDVMALLRDGAIDSMSIGYEPVSGGVEYTKTADGRSVRLLKEVKLWEVSLVTFPADEKAVITAVKSVVPYQDLPLADRERAWDADAAMGRMRQACGGPDKESMDWAKYRKGFVWYDTENASDFGGYKLPIADVLDGTLTAVPRAIFAAGAALQGARGGVDIPEGDREAARAHLAKYYAKMEMKPPWEAQGKAADFATLLATQQRRENLREERWKMDYALGQAIDGCMMDEGMSQEEKLASIAASLDQYKQAMLDWCGRAMPMMQPQEGETRPMMGLMASPGSAEWFHQALMADLGQSKAGRVLSAANARRLQAAIDSIHEILRAAGLMEPEGDGEGDADKGCDGDRDRDRRKDEEGDAAKAAADSHNRSAKAGPGGTPPTASTGAAGPVPTPPTSSETDVARLIELAEMELALLEV